MGNNEAGLWREGMKLADKSKSAILGFLRSFCTRFVPCGPVGCSFLQGSPSSYLKSRLCFLDFSLCGQLILSILTQSELEPEIREIYSLLALEPRRKIKIPSTQTPSKNSLSYIRLQITKTSTSSSPLGYNCQAIILDINASNIGQYRPPN